MTTNIDSQIGPALSAPAGNLMTTAEIAVYFGWSDAQFDRATALGFPESLVHRITATGPTARRERFYKRDQVLAWADRVRSLQLA